MRFKKHIALFFFFTDFLLTGISQDFVNGDFEINSCTPGIDELNLSNSQFNSLITGCNSFAPSLAELDIITSATWSGGPKSGNWYIGFASPDKLAIELTIPLSAGDTHTISFYEAGRENNPCMNGIEIGLSTTNNNFGTLIYTTPGPAPYDIWTPHVFTFVAPNNGQYLTLRSPNIAPCWLKLDLFCLDTICVDDFPSEVAMPNVFSPNGDGINDIFQPIILENTVEPNLTIVNRWGEIVFQTNDVANGWNGKKEGSKCPDGVYYWILKYRNERLEEVIETGFFTMF